MHWRHRQKKWLGSRLTFEKITVGKPAAALLLLVVNDPIRFDVEGPYSDAVPSKQLGSFDKRKSIATSEISRALRSSHKLH